LFGALRIYGDQWNFNSGLFRWLEVWLAQQTYLPLSPDQATDWGKRLVAVTMAGVLAGVWWAARRLWTRRSLLRLMAVPLMAYVLLTPTFHPWYLLLLLAFVPFLAPAAKEPRRTWLALLPWLYLSGAAFLSYVTYQNPQDLREFEWVRRSEWLPTLMLLGVAALALLSRREHPSRT
jgi:hypothetical protein